LTHGDLYKLTKLFNGFINRVKQYWRVETFFHINK